MNRVGAWRSRISPLCLQLSNSGDALRLLIPIFNLNVIRGWNNSPGKVTSQKMRETEMGYRGSKSELIQNTYSVKEQRVDGSWSNYNINNSLLRCTLMDFKRNYLVKILSKQLKKQNFSANAPNTFEALTKWEAGLAWVGLCIRQTDNKILS
jgi:hypothetical protein